MVCYKGQFVGADEVRQAFKDKSANFQQGYFEAYNNPVRIGGKIRSIATKINDLLTQGKLTIKTSDYFDGLKKGLADKKTGAEDFPSIEA